MIEIAPMFDVAIVEDDSPTSDAFKASLLKSWPTCRVQQFYDFTTASAALEANNFDLVISDIDLGSGSDKYGGIKIAKILHARQIPLLIVSGISQPELHRDIFRALDAWDYLQKPVSETDFTNQVTRAITFRQAIVDNEPQSSQRSEPNPDPDLVINLHDLDRVKWKGQRVNLSLTQTRILETLLLHVNEMVTYEDLFKQIATGKTIANLRVHIGQIRSALKDADPDYVDRLQNMPMIGYSWRV